MLIRLESAFLRELHVLQTPRSGLVTLEMTPILVKLPSSPSAPSPSTLLWDSRSVGDGRDTEDSLGPNPVGPHSFWRPPGGRKGAEPGAPAGKQPQAAVYPIKSSAAGYPQPGQHCSLSACRMCAWPPPHWEMLPGGFWGKSGGLEEREIRPEPLA